MSNELVNANLKAKKVAMVGGRTDGAYVEEYEAVGGLTIRDYFAAKTLNGLLANDGFYSEEDTGCNKIDEKRSNAMTIDEAADYSYRMADAMMLRRSV